MPQLVLGKGDPVAISIECGLLIYLNEYVPIENDLLRAASIGLAYWGYNEYIVPKYAVDFRSEKSVREAFEKSVAGLQKSNMPSLNLKRFK